MTTKRIKDLSVEASSSTLDDNDYGAVDSTANGTRKFKLSALATWIHNKWASFVNTLTTVTSFASGDFIAVSNPTDGARKMSKDTLLELTAQNALAGNTAPVFDPSKPNDEDGYAYYSGTNVTYGGKNYVFIVNHLSGAWNPDEVEQRPLSESINLESVGQAVQDWLDEHPEATTTVEDGSLVEAKFSDALKLKTIKDYVTPEMYGAKGDGETDDTLAFQNALAESKPIVLSKKTYVVSPIDITIYRTIIYGNGATLKQKDVNQEYVLKIDAHNVCIDNLAVSGISRDLEVLKNLSSAGFIITLNGYKCRFNSIIFAGFNKDVYANGNSFWDNLFVKCQFNTATWGVYSDHTSLAIVLLSCSANDVYTYFRFNGGDVVLLSCNLGNRYNRQLCNIINDCSSIMFINCNFEEATIDSYYIYQALAGVSRISFKGCYFHKLKMAETPSSRNGFIGTYGSGKFEFLNCRFSNNTLNNIVDYRTEISESMVLQFDYYSFSQIVTIVPTQKFVIGGIYGGNHPVVKISDFIRKSLPNAEIFGNYSRLFKGTEAHVSEETERYVFNGSSWVKKVILPEPPQSGNYTLSCTNGSMEWQQVTP